MTNPAHCDNLPNPRSDIRGVAIEGVEGEHVTLTEAATEAIGAAFARFLRQKVGAGVLLSVSVGHDSRITAGNLKVVDQQQSHGTSFLCFKQRSPQPDYVPTGVHLILMFCCLLCAVLLTLQAAVARGLASEGATVVDYGLASTPAMFNSTITEDPALLCPVTGAIMITGG